MTTRKPKSLCVCGHKESRHRGFWSGIDCCAKISDGICKCLKYRPTKPKPKRKHRHRYGKPFVTIKEIFIGPFGHPVKVELQECKCGKVKP